ncbi:phage tail tape measure protein [Bacillus haynesii]|uniref:phage tail tape measure protein n=1 Tax=Bacillus haynesii TaxID=1925021 RepID=UPI0022806FCD|nr:phage tail tape measure protein [Bacillus haynesii]MCY9148792.1 phage tail tape measure protein [Bacillus haynesii]MCY9319925.1 phage tail tape measure protein [Bacillus haynesii]
MAKDIKVRLYSNSNQFRTEMRAVAQQMKNVKSEFEKNRTAVGVWGNELRTSQEKAKTLSQQLDIHKRKVKALERAYADSAIKKGKDAQETQTLSRRLNYATAEMNKTQNALTQTTQRIKRLEDESRRASSTIHRMGQRMNAVGSTMRNVGASVAMTSGIAFGGLVLPLKDAVQVGIDFEKQMSKVQAISGGTAGDLAKLTAQAKELGATTVFTASQAADAQSFLAMAGFKTNEIYGAMPGMLSLAAAGQLELGTAADITSNIMSAFALKAEESAHAADVIAYAASNANTNVEQMGEAMKFLAPNANSLGWGMEESAAAIMAFGDAGLQGTIAGQAFGTSLIRLATPARKAQKEIDRLGFEFFDAAGNMKSMPEVIAEMEKGMKGMTKEQQAATLKTIVGAEAYKHWAVLLQKGSKALGENTKKLKESDGAAKKMADTMLDNAHGSIIQFESALEGAKIALTEGLLPSIGDLADKGSALLTMFNNLDKGTQATIGKTAVLTAGVLGVTTAVATLTAGVGALLAFTGPVGLAIVGGTALLGALGVAMYAVSEQTENMKKKQEEAREKALLFGEGVSKATQKAAGSYVDLREKAEVQLFELTRVSGEQSDKMAAKLVETYSKMRDELVQQLQMLKKDALVVINGLLDDTDKNTQKAGEKIVDKMVGNIDQDIQEAREKVKELEKLQKETGLVSSKMNDAQKRRFNEIISYFEESTSKFAANQKEALAMQKAVTEQQGKLSFKQAKEYNDKIKKVYDEGKKAAKEDYEYRNKVLNQLYAQGYIDAQQKEALLKKSLADYQKTMAKNSASYEENTRALFSKMAKNGKLLDLETQKALDRQDKYISNSMGIMVKIEESDSEYQERWAQKQIEYMNRIGENKEKAIETTRQALEDFYRGLGNSEQEAQAKADEAIQNVLEKMNGGNEKAEQAGREKGSAFTLGLSSTLGQAQETGSLIGKGANQGLSQGKTQPKQFGMEKGNAFALGLRNTLGINKQSSSVLRQSVNSELSKNSGQARTAGKEKGDQHNAGLSSTKPKNNNTAASLSKNVSGRLGQTTDGGGGKKAGMDLTKGLMSQQTASYNAGSKVSNKAKSGLKSVKTSSVGSDFVSGFVNGIKGGIGSNSLFKAAWNLGKSALSALKKSIDSHSPAKKSMAEGNNFTDGFAIGISKTVARAKRSAQALGQGANLSLKQEINKMAYNIKGAADELLSLRSELVVRNEVDTPSLNQKLDALITLLSNGLSFGGQTEPAAAGGPIRIYPAPVNIDGKQVAEIVFEQGDGRILDRKSLDRYDQNAYQSGVRRT